MGLKNMKERGSALVFARLHLAPGVAMRHKILHLKKTSQSTCRSSRETGSAEISGVLHILTFDFQVQLFFCKFCRQTN